MARKRKGRAQKNIKRAQVNKNKSSQIENQSIRDKTTAEAKNDQPDERTDSVVLISDQELQGRAGAEELHRPTVATSAVAKNTRLKSSAAIYSTSTAASTGASSWAQSALIEGTRTGKMPRPWLKKWGWWFLPLSLIGGALGAWWGVRHIEDQVQAAAPVILKAAGVDPSGLTFDADYRNIAVAGELPVGVTVDEVERILEESTGTSREDIRHATVTALAAPAPKPELTEPVVPSKPAPAPTVIEPTGEISVTAVADGQSIRLSGSVPDQQHANRLIASAALAVGEDNVVNELGVLGLTPSATEPEAQIDRLTQVLPTLGSGISSAELALGDDTFSGSIDAINTSAKSQLDPIVAAASGNGVTVTAPALELENETLQVDVFANYQGQQIVLYGEVINEAQSQTLIAAAAESVGEDNVISNLKFLQPNNEPAASDAQIASLGETLRRYGGLRSAESRLNASNLYLRGVAKNNTTKSSIDQSLQSVTDESLSVVGEITVLSMEGELNQLQDVFDGLAREIRENVVFATNSDVLDSKATEVLDKVVDAIENFERPRINVSGHTDSLGPAGANQVLSARRASAVLAYLNAKGVDVERLRAIGFGESQPIGDNHTAAGRQQNRRVEFTAVENF